MAFGNERNYKQEKQRKLFDQKRYITRIEKRCANPVRKHPGGSSQTF